MNEGQLRARIRDLHLNGETPCPDGDEPRIWAGRGHGDHCVVCTLPIASTETEFEVELGSGRVFRLHRGCYQLWRDECGSLLDSDVAGR